VLGANDGEAGRGKSEGDGGNGNGTITAGWAIGSVGTAGETARSDPPVISAQKQGPSLGAPEWLPCGWCVW
jgi:hypothetical protein